MRLMTLIFIMLWTSLFFLSVSVSATASAVKLDLKVVGQNRNLVQDAGVEVNFHGGGGSHIVFTNEEGPIRITDTGFFGQSIEITKRDYYKSRHRAGNGDQDLVLELREIKDPIAMHVSRQERVKTLIEKNLGN